MMLQEEWLLPIGEIESGEATSLRIVMILWLATSLTIGVPGNLLGNSIHIFHFELQSIPSALSHSSSGVHVGVRPPEEVAQLVRGQLGAL